VVTLTQATEVGTVYRPDELKAISATCKELGLNLHMDGARFTNACAFLGCTPAELTWKAGVDVLCFGGTKNGMAVGEAILFFNRELAEDFDYRCKQAGQLASKMRFLSAPWVGLLEDGAWMRTPPRQPLRATAGVLVSDLPGVELMFPVEANGVFLQMLGAGHRSAAQQGLALLYLHRQWWGAVHVLVGYRGSTGARAGGGYPRIVGA
jgi:threonine aldolase